LRKKIITQRSVSGPTVSSLGSSDLERSPARALLSSKAISLPL
jgi:hypothetical protein